MMNAQEVKKLWENRFHLSEKTKLTLATEGILLWGLAPFQIQYKDTIFKGEMIAKTTDREQTGVCNNSIFKAKRRTEVQLSVDRGHPGLNAIFFTHTYTKKDTLQRRGADLHARQAGNKNSDLICQLHVFYRLFELIKVNISNC